MPLFRYATSVYGQNVLVGASWDLIWWFVGAGAAFIVVHAAVKALTRSRANVSER
jgi:Mg2+ and Co2+ transporter CorA